MGKQVKVNPGFSSVRLYDSGKLYSEGATVTLTDAEYAALDAGTLRAITLLGTVSEPSRTGGTAVMSQATLLAFLPLKVALADASRSAAIQVLSDSTALTSTRWPYRLAQSLAASYPAWTVQVREWDDTAQSFAVAQTIQTGTAGARYLDCSTGTTTKRLDASVSTNLTGVIDARVKVSLPSWTPGTQVIMGGRSGTAGTRGWYLIVNTAGNMLFAYSGDAGATVSTISGTTPLTTVAQANVPIWLRWVFTPNDGAGNRTLSVYTSTDGVTWTQLGATTTTAGAVTVNNPSTVGYEVGGVAAGVGSTSLKVYEVEYRNGLNGPSVVPAIPDLWPPYSSSAAVCVGAPVLTILNGSRSGGNIAYLGDSTRLPKLTNDYGQLLTILSDSHNEGAAFGKQWLTMFDTWVGQVKAAVKAPILVLTQNPETSGSTWYREHTKRRIDLLSYARASGLDVIDTWKPILATTTWATDLMTDAVHPNSAGSDMIRDAIRSAFDAVSV